MFDKELWAVIGDDEPRIVAEAVHNTVQVRPARGAPYEVVIRVPSGFFSYMRDVAKLDAEEVKKNPLHFYLDEMSGKWYFGYSIEGEFDTDMWPYSSLPNWANRSRQVKG